MPISDSPLSGAPISGNTESFVISTGTATGDSTAIGIILPRVIQSIGTARGDSYACALTTYYVQEWIEKCLPKENPYLAALRVISSKIENINNVLPVPTVNSGSEEIESDPDCNKGRLRRKLNAIQEKIRILKAMETNTCNQ